MPTTHTLAPDHAGFESAADLLRAGGLVALPTETVYGLGADASNDQAVAKVFEAKQRPSFNPLIVHVADVAAARALVEWPEEAKALAEAFWPGPLTLVLPLRADVDLSLLVTAGLPTLAIRIPAHPVAQRLLQMFGGPIAAPSANPSGRISPTTSAHVLEGLGGKIDAVLEGGACGVGLESTILGFDKSLTLLRPGGLPAEEIESVLAMGLLSPSEAAPLTAPGQMLSHYAPDAPVRLNVSAPQDGEVWLGFGAVEADLNLSDSGDLIEAAANLFSHLHKLNAIGRPIAVAPIPEVGLGRAINDRLRRAAAPRD